ncbi:Potassium-transporting ATPase KdpC subunit [Neomoorella glycerini]|uniref:Potassium-transporting ATPase KdpC subunit n=1 Tax=Neomoorella glycerini TaxID=55779 RepID=A0A6I5ZUZ7_9FIRM|nr:potassium-transporting ATPase subunit KdpC [Moorella glycerini]QGP93912.1 Potassium-transporting ATPase KdpC subunit [Moorella glycerini]
MTRKVLSAFLMLIIMTALTGIVYPLVTTGLARVLFPHQASGSLVLQGGQVIGSALIGQKFTGPRYFHGRPSAAGEDGYDAVSSGGSNLGPTNKKLLKTVKERLAAIRAENDLSPDTPVPSDLVTASASGLDPDITPQAAYLQVPRVARARNLPEDKVRLLVDRNITGRQFGIWGEPRVNVLKLNVELDNLSP